jgi:hypothetical protein
MKWVGVAIAAWTLAQPGSAAACGDKLAMMGGGVSFERINLSRYRGNVVLLHPASSPPRGAPAEAELRRALERAGHKVRVVTGPSELDAALESRTVDVILVDGSATPSLPPRSAAAAAGDKEPILLTVVYQAPSTERSATPDSRCVVRADARRGRQVLDAIDRLLAGRARGERVPCAAAPPTHSI